MNKATARIVFFSVLTSSGFPYFDLDFYTISNLSWSEEIEFLKNSGLEIDMDSLLQARKRILVRDLFYDPEEAERRRRAQEVSVIYCEAQWFLLSACF